MWRLVERTKHSWALPGNKSGSCYVASLHCTLSSLHIYMSVVVLWASCWMMLCWCKSLNQNLFFFSSPEPSCVGTPTVLLNWSDDDDACHCFSRGWLADYSLWQPQMLDFVFFRAFWLSQLFNLNAAIDVVWVPPWHKSHELGVFLLECFGFFHKCHVVNYAISNG